MARTFGKNLRRQRVAAGYTQESLAREIDVSWITVSRWERGKSTPDLNMIGLLASVLGCTISELVETGVAA